MGLCVLYYVEYSLYNVKKVGFFYLGWNNTLNPNPTNLHMKQNFATINLELLPFVNFYYEFLSAPLKSLFMPLPLMVTKVRSTGKVKVKYQGNIFFKSNFYTLHNM